MPQSPTVQNGRENDERSSLLGSPQDNEQLSYATEVFALARLAFPIWLGNCLEFSQGAFATIVMAHLGTTELAAMGVAVKSKLAYYSRSPVLKRIIPAIDPELDCNGCLYHRPSLCTGHTLQYRIHLLNATPDRSLCSKNRCCDLCRPRTTHHRLSFIEPFLLLIRQEPELAHTSGQAMRSRQASEGRPLMQSRSDVLGLVIVWQAPFLAIFEVCRKWLLAVSAHHWPERSSLDVGTARTS